MPLAHQLSLGVEDQAGPVEDQLVLAPNGVYVSDIDPVVLGACGHHPLPESSLARMEGRSVDVDDDLGAGVPLDHHRPHGTPDVLANVHSHANPVDVVYGACGAFLEVAVLVKHPVGGQVNLVVDAHKLPAVAHSRRVVDVRVHVGVAHHHGHVTR